MCVSVPYLELCCFRVDAGGADWERISMYAQCTAPFAPWPGRGHSRAVSMAAPNGGGNDQSSRRFFARALYTGSSTCAVRRGTPTIDSGGRPASVLCRGLVYGFNLLQKPLLLGSIQCTESPNHSSKSFVVGVEIRQWHAERFRQALRRRLICGVDVLLVSVDACASHEGIQSGEDAQLLLG